MTQLRRKAGRPHVDWKKVTINIQQDSEIEENLIQQVREAIPKLRKNTDLIPKIEFYKRA